MLLAAGVLASVPAWTQTAAPGMQGSGQAENTGPNKNIVARERGTTQSRRQREDWDWIEHPDGSRTLIAATLSRAGAAQAIVRLGSAREPQAVYWRPAGTTGSGSAVFLRDAWPRGMAEHFPSAAALRAGGTPVASRRRLASLDPAPLARGVARWARGRYAYTTLKDARARGTEDFHLTVYADGSRSLLMWHDVFARHSQFTVALNIDAQQRPTGAFVSYWTTAGYKGSTHIRVQGHRLSATNRDGSGDREQALDLPPKFSIGTHPVAGDGWHTFQCDSLGPGESARVYSMEASADLTRPALGQLTELRCEAFGAERVTVPAGAFDTLHYRLAGVSDIWITRADRLMVKFTSERLDRAYTLVEYSGGL